LTEEIFLNKYVETATKKGGCFRAHRRKIFQPMVEFRQLNYWLVYTAFDLGYYLRRKEKMQWIKQRLENLLSNVAKRKN